MHRNQTCHFRNVSLPKTTNRVAGDSEGQPSGEQIEFSFYEEFESMFSSSVGPQ